MGVYVDGGGVALSLLKPNAAKIQAIQVTKGIMPPIMKSNAAVLKSSIPDFSPSLLNERMYSKPFIIAKIMPIAKAIMYVMTNCAINVVIKDGFVGVILPIDVKVSAKNTIRMIMPLTKFIIKAYRTFLKMLGSL